MTDIVKKTQEKIILAEIQAGIDPAFTDLIANPGEYWLKDESDTLSQTLYDGVIVDNFWQVNGTTSEINIAGTTSENWELSGTTLQVKI